MKTIIKNAQIINEGKEFSGFVILENDYIAEVGYGHPPVLDNVTVYDAEGALLIPGCIDDQVHFREPGLTHKGDLWTESKSAVAGGITSYMEMPNTQPPALTLELLEEKYARASEVSWANHSFYMGTASDNLKEIERCDPKKICGLKIFLGSSTGNLYVDDPVILEKVFRSSPFIIALHCEKESLIRENLHNALNKWGNHIPISLHPQIRSEEACYRSSSEAIELAEKTGARIHILHISTARECQLFQSDIPLEEKKITAEACIHHLWFCDADYAARGTWIKWNPAIKTQNDRDEIRRAVLDGRIDVVATDHAPHTLEEKLRPYTECPSGGPLVQHALVAMLEMAEQGLWPITHVVELMCHKPARLFQIEKRGFLRPGYYADIVLVEKNSWKVSKENILYKCGWSPFENQTFQYKVKATFVNGQLLFDNGHFNDFKPGYRLTFDR